MLIEACIRRHVKLDGFYLHSEGANEAGSVSRCLCCAGGRIGL